VQICLYCEGISATEQTSCTSCGAPLLPMASVHYPLRRGEGEAPSPLLGSVVDGKYRILGTLGRGGMGTVFRAVHAVSLLPMALKVLNPRFASRSGFRSVLLQEARRAGRVVHESCARVLDVGEAADGTVYLAMELAEGETLDALMRGGPLRPQVAVAILRQIARALVAIHAQDLVHGDLSARNVMVAVRDGAPVVKVLDFGIARQLRSPGGEGAARSLDATAAGNPVFSAPEQLAGREVGARADLYSFGVIGRFLLTGSLPVEAEDAQRAAEFTMSGRLLPLQPLAGVPRRLLRLLQRCTQSAPEQRPDSAAAVLAELDAIASPHRPLLAAVAIAAALATVVVVWFAFADTADPFLRPVPGSPLGFAVPGDTTPPSVQFLRSVALATLECDFGGFPAERLQATLSRGGRTLLVLALAPVADQRGGRLTLASAQHGWRQLVMGALEASRGGPVDLTFAVPGVRVLGTARVLVDDDPPEVDAELLATAAAPGVLRADTALRLAVADAGGMFGLRLSAQRAGAPATVLTLATDAAEFALGNALATAWPGVQDQGPVVVQLQAIDRAGNTAAGKELRWQHCDLAAPTPLQVVGRSGLPVITYLDDAAVALVQLSAAEPGLRVGLQDGDGRDCCGGLQEVAGHGTTCELRLLGRSGEQPFVAGTYVCIVEDAAGNRSAARFPLSFRSERIDALLRVAPSPGPRRADVVGRQIVAVPDGADFEFSCNAAFRVARALLLLADGSPPPGGVDQIALDAGNPAAGNAAAGSTAAGDPASGRTAVRLPALVPGAYRVELELEQLPASQLAPGATVVYALRVLPAQVALHVPERQTRFLPGCTAAGLLAEREGLVRDGPGWRCNVDLRLLRGHAYIGGDQLVATPLGSVPFAEDSAAPRTLLPPFLPRNGRNVVALAVVDLLDRPVAVYRGDQPAPTLEQDGRRVQVVAEFWHDRDGPRLVGEELPVEHGQPLRVQVHCPWPLVVTEAREVRLTFGPFEGQPATIGEPTGGACTLAFSVPVAAWTVAADLSSVTRSEYANAIARSVKVALATPAGRFPLDLRLRTTRSNLRPADLGEIFGFEAVPAALRDLHMVPVLADGAWPEQVPAAVPFRELFRAQMPLEVRGFSEFLLQDREVTHTQYAAVVAALQRRDFGGLLLHHADDPMGRRRCTLVGMAIAQDPPASGDAARPVTGVDFFQAYAFARALGAVVGGDPDLFRLPLGCELEYAALQGAPHVARNAAAAHGRPIPAVRFLAAAADLRAGRCATAATCAAAGDVMTGSAGGVLHGLDFGVREWVFDLTQGPEFAEASALREWLRDQRLHVERAEQLAKGLVSPPAEIRPRLRRFGVIRGLALGELDGLLGADGRTVVLAPSGVVPASVPGVLRSEQMRRDGGGLVPSARDPRLGVVGFRVAGGAALIARLRRR
jgi:hypothetical protein